LKKGDFGFLFRLTEEKGVFVSMKDVEKDHIGHILKLCRWNVSKAASMLEINRVTLHHKIKKYGLTQEH